jgi:hypothetical protein
VAVSKAYQELAALGLAVRLSEMADDTGVVFVTVDSLAEQFGAKRDTIIAMVKHLEESGIVWKGRGKLIVRRVPVTGTKVPVMGTKVPVTGMIVPVNGHEHEEILDSKILEKHESLKLLKENKKNTHAHPVAKPRRVAADDPGFKEFWASYPRRVGKVNAAKWWEKHWPNDEELMSILHGVDMWTDHWQERGTEVQFIPHPATWLNAERWTEEPS